ncbi:Dolichol-phosphate mannosyltransferase subunit 3 - like 1 [Theobroma cacao]|nr:Dolichol-phosphate mannosyltransferase subunit 3 - like 1 [Theobroma cacao]
MFCFCSIVFYYFVELFFISAEVTAAPPATPLPSCLPRFFTTLSSSPSSSLSLTTLSVFFLPLSITARSQPSSYLFRASQLVRIVFLWSFLDRFQEIVAFEGVIGIYEKTGFLTCELIIIANPMKHVLKIFSLLVAISGLWIGLLQASIIPRSHTWLLPIYFIVSLGCYGLLMVGVGLMRFPTCPQEALLLQQDIAEAKYFLKQRGVDVDSE